MLMRHIRGGWHEATAQEVEEMKKNGWVESSEAERRKIIEEKKLAMVSVDERDSLSTQYFAKNGKKPHPAMKLETLREAVKE